MRQRWFVLAVILLLTGLGTSSQSPETQPLLQASDVRYLGSFIVPSTDGTSDDGGRLIYGGEALSVTPDGEALYFGCVPVGTQPDRIAKISIPAIGAAATVLVRCQDIPNIVAIDPDASDGFVLGGSIEHNNRLVVSVYSYYDAQESVQGNLTHFWGTPNLAGFQGPVKVGTGSAGLTAGYMAPIPTEWRELFGGPAFTGLCCINNIARSSYGPALRVFNPDDVGTKDKIPTTVVLEYPQGRPLNNDWNVTSTLFNGTTKVGGVVFPTGTRSVLFFGRQGTGTFCYGNCEDPASSYRGSHAYPYRHQIWAYDANDLVAVKTGKKDPSEVRPYDVWPITAITEAGDADVTSVAYHQATRRLYVTTAFGTDPRVHVFEISSPSPKP